MTMGRRVVVTGLGAVTPLGRTLTDSWTRLLANGSGITSLQTALHHQGLPADHLDREWRLAQTLSCQVAAACDTSSSITYDARTPRFVQLTLVAAQEALQQAQLLDWLGHDTNNNDEDPLYDHRRDRIGVCVGSGMSGVREIVNTTLQVQQLESNKSSPFRRAVSPHFVPKVLSNSAAGRLSLQYQLRGPNHSASTACAAGSHAIGDAWRMIQHGAADVMVAGGAEACIDPLSLAGFAQLRALSTKCNDEPTNASRPFDVGRDGFVMAEGAALLVLEDLEHAQARQAHILAELCGYGLTGDAHHITAPDPQGRGAYRAMHMALQEAGGSGRVGYINAHATSTPKGDDIEAQCIRRLFPQTTTSTHHDNTPVWISSTKGATGHLLGAAGALEAAFTVLALRHQVIPHTRNLGEWDDDSKDNGVVQHVTQQPHVFAPELPLEVAMSNSFGFGGTNASLVFRRWTDDQ